MLDCPVTGVMTRPADRTGTTTTPAGAASTRNDFGTTGLTDAMAHVLPRTDWATIVVAPVATPVTTTDASVWPAGIRIEDGTVAIDESMTLRFTARSVDSADGSASRRMLVPPRGTPRSRGTARSAGTTFTTT